MDFLTLISCNKHRVNGVIDKLKTVLKWWKELQYIDNSTFKSLFITSSNIVSAYAVPKIHKDNTILIITSVNSPPKFLQSTLIKKGLNEESHQFITNSHPFLDSIQFLRVPNNYKLDSLDVI